MRAFNSAVSSALHGLEVDRSVKHPVWWSGMQYYSSLITRLNVLISGSYTNKFIKKKGGKAINKQREIVIKTQINTNTKQVQPKHTK